MSLDPQAQQLNQTIAATHPQILDMLSSRGKAIFFPKLGILSQSAEAQGKAINATVGIALEDDGSPLCLPSLAEAIHLSKVDAFTYAPSSGRPDLRKLWKELQVQKNPGLQGITFSLPVVSAALTHGLSTAAYLFCEAGDRLITPDLYWENYDLIFSLAFGTALETFPTFTSEGRFNVAGLRDKLHQGPKGGKRIVSLNFPNNPSGYSPGKDEADAIVNVLREAAEAGNQVVVVIDDAYFGLVFEDHVFPESIFVPLCKAHPNLLAVKIDGATKEDYVWGFRVGFITYGIQGGTSSLYAALEAKTSGAIRGNVSSSSQPAQSLLVAALTTPGYAQQKQRAFDLLRRRYETVKDILEKHAEYREAFVPLPFNSGYFMCIRPIGVEAEVLRKKLLTDYSTGTINFNGVLRLAFSATPTVQLPQLFENVFQACKALKT